MVPDAVPRDSSLQDWLQQELQREQEDSQQAARLLLAGWHRVQRPPDPETPWPPAIDAEITLWLQRSTSGAYKELWDSIMFELEEDAVLFRLAWR